MASPSFKRRCLARPVADADLASLVRAFREQLESVAEDAKEVLEKVAEEAQYEWDKQLGKAMAQHPELYAELRKTFRQVKKTLDKVGQDLGLK